jgi:predicted TIM-barrel fold metal-dependent hydrolase
VLETFPGVFSGIGEFTIHKEFVSGKVAGDVASLDDPAFDRILAFAAETGLLVLIHCDVDIPMQKPDEAPRYLTQMMQALNRHPDATVIWAHMGLGRVVHPNVRSEHASELGARATIPLMLLEEGLADSRYPNLYHDISWDEVAKWVVADPETTQAVADIINEYPDRFLYGSDAVAPADEGMLVKTYEMYAPLWELLTPEAREMVLKGNHERLFDAAAARVRAWERENVQ